jgi:hypothetical protein
MASCTYALWRKIMKTKRYTKRPVTIKAVQYSKANFEELLKDGWVDGLDRFGVYVKTNYLEEGDYIMETLNIETYTFENQVVKKDAFESKYIEVPE